MGWERTGRTVKRTGIEISISSPNMHLKDGTKASPYTRRSKLVICHHATREVRERSERA
jgi:hypothetical protein